MHQVFSLLDCSLAHANVVVFAFISDRALFESILHPSWCLRCISFRCFFSLSFPLKQAQNLNPSAHLQSPSSGPAAASNSFSLFFSVAEPLSPRWFSSLVGTRCCLHMFHVALS